MMRALRALPREPDPDVPAGDTTDAARRAALEAEPWFPLAWRHFDQSWRRN